MFSDNNTKFWKIALMILGAMMLVFTLMYSNFLAESLRKNELKNIYLFKQAVREFIALGVSDEVQQDIKLFNTIIDSFPLPVIFEDEDGLLDGQNFTSDKLKNPHFLQSKKKEFLESGQKPIEGSGYTKYIYTFNSPLLNYIRLFPLVQGILVGLYIALGYFLFNASRKSEQNRVWAGMAKETAHQLGTPISAILGWIEYLKDVFQEKPDEMDVLQELTKDVNRLELVADRFSKIGSEPVLENTEIIHELNEVKEYLERRSPKKIVYQFPMPNLPIYVSINKHLFAWVIENLIRNSLDALDGKGIIACQVSETAENVMIDLSDNGHGIPSNKFKSVFKPGYSTKKRGWGLGLSLAKRIIEEYHKGKIFVKSSKPYDETVFRILLPKKNKK